MLLPTPPFTCVTKKVVADDTSCSRKRAHAQTHAPHALNHARAQGDTRQGYLGSTGRETPLQLRLGSLDRTPNTMLTRHTHKHAPACTRAQ